MNPLLFLGFFGASVFGGLSVGRADRDAEKDLKAKIQGDQKSVSVEIHPGIETLWGELPSVNLRAKDFSCRSLPFHSQPGFSKYGRIRHLRFQLENFQLKSLPVRTLTADLTGCRFDLAYALKTHHLRITKGGTGPITIDLNFDDVKRFALKKYPQIKELNLSIEGARIALNGSASLGFGDVKFEVSGEPGLQDGTKLVLLNPSVELNGKAMTGPTLDQFLKPFTPLVDLDRDLGAEGAIHLQRIQMGQDGILGYGVVGIPAENGSVSTTPTVAK